MKKYLYIFKSEIMSNLQYAFDIFVGFIGYAVHIFIFLNYSPYLLGWLFHLHHQD